MLLIVGSGGLLGRHAEEYFRSLGKPVITASHRPGTSLHVDLYAGIGDFERSLPEGITHALICSGLTDIDACRRDRERSFLFNVTNTVSLLEALLSRGIRPVLCSSDLVFEGTRGNYREDDSRFPTTEYGCQKKAVEDYLLHQQTPMLILRMSKLYSREPGDPSPIGSMRAALAQGKRIRCATDQVLCPTLALDIPKVLNLLIEYNATGVYHVASPFRYTRYDLGLLIAHRFGREQLVEQCSIKDFPFVEPRPVNNSLDVSKLQGTIPFSFARVEDNLAPFLS